jgi:hypothetical protein
MLTITSQSILSKSPVPGSTPSPIWVICNTPISRDTRIRRFTTIRPGMAVAT